VVDDAMNPGRLESGEFGENVNDKNRMEEPYDLTVVSSQINVDRENSSPRKSNVNFSVLII
jgi:hypothetical protein